MSKNKEKKRFQWKALLISFGITCVMQGAVIGLTLWYKSKLTETGKILWKGDLPELIIGNIIAFLIVFLIIFLFLRKPRKKEYSQQENWNP